MEKCNEKLSFNFQVDRRKVSLKPYRRISPTSFYFSFFFAWEQFHSQIRNSTLLSSRFQFSSLEVYFCFAFCMKEQTCVNWIIAEKLLCSYSPNFGCIWSLNTSLVTKCFRGTNKRKNLASLAMKANLVPLARRSETCNLKLFPPKSTFLIKKLYAISFFS